jgi:hypothetical protein
MITSALARRWWKPLGFALAIMLCVMLAVLCIQLLALATDSRLPDGTLLSTGPLH